MRAVRLLLLVAAIAGCGEHLPPPTGDRVLLIGVDAATWTVIRPLIDAGRLPTFARLVREGWSGPLVSMEPTVSPAIWTTIATGKRPEEHGILGFLADAGSAGPPVPVTSNLRRAETLWTIASRAGRRVNVVAWYVTWPVEPVNGVMVSDRFVPQSLPADLGGARAAVDEQHPAVYPAGLATELERFVIGPDDFLDPAERDFHRAYRIYPVDASRVAIAEHLMATRPADLTMVYVWGIDPIQHHFWRYYEPDHFPGPPPTPTELLGGRDVIPEYYEDVDTFLARFLATTGPRDTVVIVSDHGAGVVDKWDPKTEISGAHRIEGVVIVWGNHVRPGTAATPPSVLDVTPTALYLLGLPTGADMPGHVMTDAIDPALLGARPPSSIPTYERGRRPAGAQQAIPSALDEDIRKRLRSLGYIE